MRDSLDEVHVVTRAVSCRNECGLTVSFSGETWRAHVGYPNLNRPQSLGPHPGPVRAYPLSYSHVFMLHVTATPAKGTARLAAEWSMANLPPIRP